MVRPAGSLPWPRISLPVGPGLSHRFDAGISPDAGCQLESVRLLLSRDSLPSPTPLPARGFSDSAERTSVPEGGQALFEDRTSLTRWSDDGFAGRAMSVIIVYARRFTIPTACW